MRRLETRLDGPLLLAPAVHGDDRGFFTETFRAAALAEHGVEHDWIQDNQSRSRRGVVRGMHFQIGAGAAKLVRCARGRILDVVADLRRGSPTYAQWEGFVLDDEALRVLYVPIGFAHGFCVLSDVADVVYKQTNYYSADVERGVRYDDPELAIEWPADVPLKPSQRDAEAPLLRDVADGLPFTYPAR